MRWEEQKVDAEESRELPGYRDPAVVRTFDAPEALDTRFYEVRAKSALNHVPKRSPMPFRWTVNPCSQRPDLIPLYERLYARGAYAPLAEGRRLAALVRMAPGTAPSPTDNRFTRSGWGNDEAAAPPRLF